MNNILSFVLGVVVGALGGALAALLLAPQSGEELRARIQQEATAEGQRVQARYEKGKEDLKHRVDRSYDDLRSPYEQSEAASEQAAGESQ